MVNDKQRVSLVFVFAVIFFLIHKIVPVIGYNTPAIVNIANLAYIYAYLLFKSGIGTYMKSGMLMIFGVFFLSLIYGAYSNLFLHIYGFLQILVYPMITIFMLNRKDEKSIKRIILSIWIAYLCTSVTTILGCSIYPEAPREIAAMLSIENPALYHIYMNLNIGSLSFVYTIVLIVPILFYIIRFRVMNRLLVLGCLCIIIITIYMSQYATALLLLAISLCPLLMQKHIKSSSVIFWGVVFFCCLVFFKSLIADMFIDISNIVDSEIIAERFRGLSEYMNGDSNSAGDDVASRQEMYGASIDAFINSPLWGTRGSVGGGHSYILDIMAHYGLIGIVAVFIMYRKIFIIFYKPWKQSKCYGYLLLIFVMSIILAILNPKELLIVHTIIVPLTFQYLYIKSEKYESIVGRK